MSINLDTMLNIQLAFVEMTSRLSKWKMDSPRTLIESTLRKRISSKKFLILSRKNQYFKEIFFTVSLKQSVTCHTNWPTQQRSFYPNHFSCLCKTKKFKPEKVSKFLLLTQSDLSNSSQKTKFANKNNFL